jgi:hypothetical protein
VLVNFVGDREGIPCDAEVANALELGALEYFSGGIVRRVDDDGFGLGANARLSSSRSKFQSGGRSCTKRGVAPERIASGP